MKNNTPRTDEQAGALIDAEEVVPADFARELERENAALRADKERLDWMAVADYWADIALFRTPEGLRAAIDAARKEAQP